MLTLAEVNGSYLKFGNSSEDIWIYLQVADIKSPPKQYHQVDSKWVVGSFQSFLYVSLGKLLSINWMDGCLGECGNTTDQCITNICGINIENCYQDPLGVVQGVCNIKAYVSFTGSDSTNRPLVSGGSLPNNYKKMSLGYIYDQAAGMKTTQQVL